MPIPTAYTEKTLAEYMHTQLGKVAAALSLHPDSDGAGDYEEAVNDAILAYGAENLTGITGVENIRKIRALAMVAVWQVVVNNFAAYYDHSSDGASYNRDQLFKHAKESLDLAKATAAQYDTQYFATITSIDRRQDPYAYRPEEENAD